MKYAQLNSTRLPDEPPNRIGDTHNVQLATLYKHGWRKVDVLPDPPEGHVTVGVSYEQDPARPYFAVPSYEYRSEAEIEQEQEDAAAPDTGWDNLSRRDQFLLRCLWKLAKEHWPNMTLQQFLSAVRAEYDATNGGLN